MRLLSLLHAVCLTIAGAGFAQSGELDRIDRPPQPVSTRLTKRLVHPDHDRRISAATFTPDGRWLAVACQESPEDLKAGEEVSPFDLPQPRIFLFDMKTEGPPEEIVTPHGQIGRLAFSPDGKTIALSATGCVWLFDVSQSVSRK